MNDENIERIEEVFLGIGRSVCRLIGWKEAIGQVYVLLYIRNHPLCLDEISELTGLSKSNVWGIMQQLMRLGAVNKAWNRGNRKDYFIAEMDFDSIWRKGILPLLNTKVDFLDGYLDSAKQELDSVLRNLKAEDPGIVENYEHVLEVISQQNKTVRHVINSLLESK